MAEITYLMKNETMDELHTCYTALQDVVGVNIKAYLHRYADALKTPEMSISSLTEELWICWKLQQNRVERLLDQSQNWASKPFVILHQKYLLWSGSKQMDVMSMNLIMNSGRLNAVSNDAELLDLH